MYVDHSQDLSGTPPTTLSVSSSLPVYRKFGAKGSNLAAELLRYGKAKAGCLSLAQGEGVIQTPSFISEAVTKALHNGKTFYSPVGGLPELRQEISDYYARIYNFAVPSNRITVTSSGTHAVHTALRAILEEGDDVVAVTPIWKNLIGITELLGGAIREFPMDRTEEGWRLDLDGLFRSVTSATKVLLLVTPNNPTGWTMREDEVVRVLKFARERKIWIVADEVYGRCVHHGIRAPSFLDHADGEDRLFVINSFSKSWAMTGWRLGWLVGPTDSENLVRDLLLYETMGVPPFLQYGAIEALREGETFLAEQKKLWSENLALIAARLSQMKGVRMMLPPSSFYVFLQVDGCPDSYALTRDLIDNAGVSLAPGSAFGAGFHDYLRLCFAVSPEILLEALDRLENFLNRCGKMC